MKLDSEFGKKLLIVGAVVIFLFFALSLISEKDNTVIFVDGDVVDEGIPSLGSIGALSDAYEYDPGETMKVSMLVTNDRDDDYDFMVKMWEEKVFGSQEILAYESLPVTIKKGQSHTFTTEYQVPLKPGECFYSIVSYYAPVGHSNFATYDDGDFFMIKVLDTTPVAEDDGTPTATDTPEPTPTPTTTPLVTDVPPPVAGDTGIEDEEDRPLIDLEDEPTQIGIALIIMASIPIIGFFIIRYRKR